MILFQSVFSTFSTILSILCFAYLIGLGLFVLIRSIVLKIKVKKEVKKRECEEEQTIK